MRILVTGASGLLGSRILVAGRDSHEMICGYHRSMPNIDGMKSLRFDIADPRATMEAAAKARPDVLVHTAGMTDVDRCEVEKKEAWRVNVDGTSNLATAARKLGAKLVYISTDYVFDGKGGPYSEDAVPNPVNYYGSTKLEGERLLAGSKDALIVRSTVIFGWRSVSKHNFASWLINQLEQDRVTRVVTDQYGTPTLAESAAEIIMKLVEEHRAGIYNVVGRDRVNRFEFANLIADAFGLRRELIKPVTTEELGQKARRPLLAGLSPAKVENELGVEPLGLREALSIMKKQRKEGSVQNRNPGS